MLYCIFPYYNNSLILLWLRLPIYSQKTIDIIIINGEINECDDNEEALLVSVKYMWYFKYVFVTL